MLNQIFIVLIGKKNMNKSIARTEAYDIDETPKHKKKAKKKKVEKCNHKHQWANCVYDVKNIWDNTYQISIGTYCPVCGKIGKYFDDSWVDKITNQHKYKYVNSLIPIKYDKYEWNKNAIKEFNITTRTLPHFYIDNAFDKYVNIKGA